MENKYQVTAIVSTYASERFIEGCLRNLLNQTIVDQLEIIVIDSCSPQNEGAIVKQFQKEHSNIVYVRTEERETIYSAWNRGIKLAKSKYITNANTDDRLRSDAYEIMAKELDQDDEIALVYSDLLVTNSENQVFENHIRTGCIMNPEYAPEIMLDRCYMGPHPMWRKSIHSHIGFFDGNYKSAGDYEFWCRIATQFRMKHIPDFLGLYLHNTLGIANSNIELSLKETAHIKEIYRNKLPKPIKADMTDNFYTENIYQNNYVHLIIFPEEIHRPLELFLTELVKFTAFPYTSTLVVRGINPFTKDTLNTWIKQGLVQNAFYTESEPTEVCEQAGQLAPNAKYLLTLHQDYIPKNKTWLKTMASILNTYKTIHEVSYDHSSGFCLPFFFFKTGTYLIPFNAKHNLNKLRFNTQNALRKQTNNKVSIILSFSDKKANGLKRSFSLILAPISYVLFFIRILLAKTLNLLQNLFNNFLFSLAA